MEKNRIGFVLKEFSDLHNIPETKVNETLENLDKLKQSISQISQEEIQDIKNRIGTDNLKELEKLIKTVK